MRINAGVILALGVAMLVPLVISFVYGDGSWISFAMPAAAMIAVGGVGFWMSRTASGQALVYVSNRDVLISVTAAWILAAVLGGIPYLVEGTFADPINSTFEAMSGFTTTGATLLKDIEAPTQSIQFWRCMTQWLGGVGIVVLFVAVAPVLGFGAARLLSAEVSGIDQPRLTPRIVDTAKALLVIYTSLTAAEVVALLFAGMNLYDAVLHAFTTIATGGFNPKNASIGFYDSVAIEVVITVFMAISAVSFALYYLLYSQRSLKILLDRELLTYVGILITSIVFVWGILIYEGQYEDAWVDALRYAAFDVTSVLTTTGYVTADFDQWETGAKFTLLLLMFIGGCAGSTAGGIKVVRVMIVLKTILGNLLRAAHPQAIVPLKLGDRIIPEKTRVAVLGLFSAWILAFVAATFLVAIQPDLSLISSVSAVAATLNVIGPGLDQVGSTENYRAVNDFGRAVLTACMLLGRLEILTVLALLSPAFWRK